MKFSIYGENEVDNVISKGYKIVHYVDSVGCTSCKLNLLGWKDFITMLDSITNCKVPILFFIHFRQKRELKFVLKESSFDYPICMDKNNDFCRVNGLSSVPILRTFLLDKNNRVVMGDPVNNPRVKELYIELIKGNKVQPELKDNL